MDLEQQCGDVSYRLEVVERFLDLLEGHVYLEAVIVTALLFVTNRCLRAESLKIRPRPGIMTRYSNILSHLATLYIHVHLNNFIKNEVTIKIYTINLVIRKKVNVSCLLLTFL